jgi:hypothetical protein
MTDATSDVNVQIGLSGWIIADGNYADFCVGETRSFALEYYNQEPLRPLPKSRDRRGMILIREALYAVSGRLAFEGPEWAVMTSASWLIANTARLTRPQNASKARFGSASIHSPTSKADSHLSEKRRRSSSNG